MEVIIVDDVAQFGAQRICELIAKKPKAILGLATGSTPIAMYRYLIQLYKNQEVSFRQVSTFNLDEYVGLKADNPQSYRYFMNRKLFHEIDIDLNKTHFPACEEGSNPREVGFEYEKLIAQSGGIDLQVLGIGGNGHIGFNEPGSSLSSRTRVKTLTKRTVEDNSRFFSEGEFQPHLAMTMGIATILSARYVMLLATGEAKAEAVRRAIEGPVSAMCPASALQLHERTAVIVDQAAASALEQLDYYVWAHNENALLAERYGNYYDCDSEP